MEKTNPGKRRYREVDSFDNFHSRDEARHYLGNNFQIGGVEFGKSEGRTEEELRNLSRFGEKVWNEKDYAGLGPEIQKSDIDIFHEVCEALTDNPKLDASGIEVEVVDGRVHLQGQVASRMDKREAEHSVEFLPGVRDVVNSLRFEY